MKAEVYGKVVESYPLKEGVSKDGFEWKEWQFSVEHGDVVRPSRVLLTCRNRKVNDLGIELGSVGKFTCWIESHKWQDKEFNSFECYQFEPAASAPKSEATTTAEVSEPAKEKSEDAKVAQAAEEELPF